MPEATRGYIEWLQPQIPRLRMSLPDLRDQIRRKTRLLEVDGLPTGTGPDRKKRRGWLMPLHIFGIGAGPQSASSGLRDGAGEGGEPDEDKQLKLDGDLEARSDLPPLPPFGVPGSGLGRTRV